MGTARVHRDDRPLGECSILGLGRQSMPLDAQLVVPVVEPEEVERRDDFAGQRQEYLKLDSPELSQPVVCDNTGRVEQHQHEFDRVVSQDNQNHLDQLAGFLGHAIARLLVELSDLAVEAQTYPTED